jgi:helix-turn-helix protein
MGIYKSIEVLRHSQAVGSSRLVLLAISVHINPSGIAWPSYHTLAAETKLSRRHVIRLVKRLEASGELEVTRRVGYSNVYRLKLSTPQMLAQGAGDTYDHGGSAALPTPEIQRKEDIALARLETWLTPGSKVWALLSTE